MKEKTNSTTCLKICGAICLGFIAALIILVSIQQEIARGNMLAYKDEQADAAAAARGWIWRNEKSEVTVRQGFNGQVLDMNSNSEEDRAWIEETTMTLWMATVTINDGVFQPNTELLVA